jgi:hypothetical protein
LEAGVLEIRFHPESGRDAFVAAAAEYQRLWDEHGERIVAQLVSLTGLRFVEDVLNALVFEGISHSHPLCLRASYDAETKLGALIHELAHRLVAGNRARLGLPPYHPDRNREEHELIDLFLFDAWTDLYGEAFARRQVAIESRYQPFYREAWERRSRWTAPPRRRSSRPWWRRRRRRRPRDAARADDDPRPTRRLPARAAGCPGIYL